MAKGKNKKKGGKLGKHGESRRCCRRYCIGCPWTIAQLNRKGRR